MEFVMEFVMELSWNCHGIVMEWSWNGHGIDMEQLWNSHGIVMEKSWNGPVQKIMMKRFQILKLSGQRQLEPHIDI